jgi:hypothetical protein
VTDAQGHLLHGVVHAANVHDTVAGCHVIEEAFKKYPTLKGVCADAGYRKTFENHVAHMLQKTVDPKGGGAKYHRVSRQNGQSCRKNGWWSEDWLRKLRRPSGRMVKPLQKVI